jgi:hypothetical protein
MKKLKKFESFLNESLTRQELVEGISEICLELNDMNFRTSISTDFKDIRLIIDIFSKGYRESYHIYQILDTLERLLDFSEQNGWSLNIRVPAKHHNDVFMDVVIKDNIPYIINYYGDLEEVNHRIANCTCWFGEKK